VSVYQSGIAPQYLDVVKSLMVQFKDLIFSDDIAGALNVLRYMLAIHFPDDRDRLTKEYEAALAEINRISQVCREKEGSNRQNMREQIYLQKAEVFRLFTLFMDAYHTKDTFILKVQQFGGIV